MAGLIAFECAVGLLAEKCPLSQVLVVQATPKGPLVIANTEDSDGDEEPTHWPAPWPAVASALKQPLQSPLTVTGRHADANYQHRLIPLDPTGTRCLFINTTIESLGWLGLRGCLVLLGALLGAVLSFVPRSK